MTGSVKPGDTIGILRGFGAISAGEECLVLAVSDRWIKLERLSNHVRFHMGSWRLGLTFEVLKPQPRSHRKKFVRGMQVSTTSHFADLVAMGEWIYFDGKAYHPAFLMGWNLRFIQNAINRGMVFKAIRLGSVENPRSEP
jgi:hypothetical protein